MLGLYLKTKCSDTASCASTGVSANNFQGWYQKLHWLKGTQAKRTEGSQLLFCYGKHRLKPTRHYTSTEPDDGLPQEQKELSTLMEQELDTRLL